MTFDEYQADAVSTDKYREAKTEAESQVRLMHKVTGLVSEVGEVLQIFHKFFFDRRPYVRAEVAEELGDVLYFVAALAAVHNLRLEDVAAANCEKRHRKYSNDGAKRPSARRVR